MRHFRIAWPAVLALVGCTTFLFAYVADARDFSDGDCYYHQKYGYIYAQVQQPFGNDMSADAPIDGTITTEHGEETDSYIYQYEEAEAHDSQAQDTEKENSEAMDNYDKYDESQYPEDMDTESDEANPQGSEVMKNNGFDYELRYSEAMDYTDQDTESQDDESQDNEAMDSETMDYYESQDHDSQNTTQGSEADGYGYTYALPESMYGTSIDPNMHIIEAEELLMKQPWDASPQYSDSQYMGSPYTTEYPGEFDNNEHLALFTWDPAELLTLSDQETLRLLALVGDRSPGVRRAVLSDYLESLGLEATDLANRFEGECGLAVLSLADDLAQTAAFLACFRLTERGELENDEALRLLLESLSHRSDRWNNWVDKITVSELNIYSTDDTGQTETAQTDTSAAGPVLRAVVLTAADSLERLGCVINGLSRQMKNLY